MNRWYVEIVSQSRNASLCVEASTWKGAVFQAQRMRGESIYGIQLHGDGEEHGEASTQDGKCHFRVSRAPQETALTAAPVDTAKVLSETLYDRSESTHGEHAVLYRERGLQVPQDASLAAVTGAIRVAFDELYQELSDAAGMKFVRIAAFDHHFSATPERPPVASLIWRNWKGEPILEVDSDKKPLKEWEGVWANLATADTLPGTIPSPATVAVQTAMISEEPLSARSRSTVRLGSVKSPVASEPLANVSDESDARLSPLSGIPVASVRRSSNPPADEPSAPRLSQLPTLIPGDVSQPVLLAQEEADEKSKRITAKEVRRHLSAKERPRPARTKASEELVSELFERMQPLYFAHDVVEGAQLVLEALSELIPCEAALIYVFDINAREFCVVRAEGKDGKSVLLERVPHDEPLFKEVLQSGAGQFVTRSADAHQHFRAGRYRALLVDAPRVALVGAVRQGGRYLGVIELLNPHGDQEFYASEQNAVEYVCQQFAELVAQRPVVLDADVVMSL